MLLTELPEREASGRIREIYGEMKHLGGVPMVALIFRHLATLPGGLEWAWDAIGPLWREGRLQESAWKIAREASLKPLAAIPREALPPLGVDEAGLREIRVVVDAYNVANPENMLSILCLLRLVHGAKRTGTVGIRPWVAPAAPGPLVAMTDVKAMSPEVVALLDLVAAPNAEGGPRVVQSLYRHFAHRPAFLALAVTLLRQRIDDGSIEGSVHTIREAMKAKAKDLARACSAPPAPHAGIQAVCERFSSRVIPQMIVVGRLLEAALPADLQ